MDETNAACAQLERAYDLFKQIRPVVCVCLICDGPSELGAIGVTDFSTAEAWRLKDTKHRAFMMFTFGEFEDVEFEIEDGESNG